MTTLSGVDGANPVRVLRKVTRMVQHGYTVTCHVGVHFDDVGALVESELVGFERVLGGVGRRAAVG